MATVKISALTTITGASVDQANDVIPIVDATGPETKKITVAQLLGLVSTSITVGTTTTTGTTGSVLFCDTGVVQEDNTNFYWDNTNNRLGLGATAPAARLDIRSAGALSTDLGLRVRNSANTLNLWSIAGQGELIHNYNLSLTTTIPISYLNNTVQSFALYSNGGVAIGGGATAVNFGTTEAGISIGVNANSFRGDNIAIGNNSSYINNVGASIFIGTYAGTYSAVGGTCGIVLGRYSSPNSAGGIIIGSSARGNASDSICVGNYIEYGSAATAHLSVFGSFHTIANGVTNTISLGDGVNSTTRAQPRVSDSLNVFLATQEQVFFVNNKTNVVLSNVTSLTSGTHFEAATTNAITIHIGTAPVASPANASQIYVADWNGAGTATPMVRNEEGHTVKLYRGAAVADATGAGDVVAQLNALLARLRVTGGNGLIAD